MYARVMALIGHALDNWAEFDGYCAVRGIDPLKLPSRRFINTVWYWMIEGREQEHINKLIEAFYHLEQAPKPKKPERRLQAVPEIEDEKEGNKKVVPEPGKKWRAPEGWTPDNWNEYQSYQSAKQFMGFQANPNPKKKK